MEVFKDVKLKNDEILVSFDVKSLFTSIPIEEAISVCESRLNEDTTLKTRTDLSVQTIIQLLRFCLTSITFQYDGKHYQQKDGLAIVGDTCHIAHSDVQVHVIMHAHT